MDSRSYRVAVTQAAQRDIQAIENYLLEQTSIRTAGRVLESLDERIRSLRSMPQRFRTELIADRSFHTATEGSYTIYYNIADETVSVIRVLHASRDRERLLSDQS